MVILVGLGDKAPYQNYKQICQLHMVFSLMHFQICHAAVFLRCKFQRNRWTQRGVHSQKLLEMSHQDGNFARFLPVLMRKYVVWLGPLSLTWINFNPSMDKNHMHNKM